MDNVELDGVLIIFEVITLLIVPLLVTDEANLVLK